MGQDQTSWNIVGKVYPSGDDVKCYKKIGARYECGAVAQGTPGDWDSRALSLS